MLLFLFGNLSLYDMLKIFPPLLSTLSATFYNSCLGTSVHFAFAFCVIRVVDLVAEKNALVDINLM